MVSKGPYVMSLFQQPASANHRLARLRPDFLILSPPKTGSTWLAANLRCHPQLFIPDIKEIKYFNSLYQWLDLDWYLDHFRPACGRMKGEASPSYAVLPVETIRHIHQLLPDVKLIYLMREPTGRAWSHARHNATYREANFASCPPESAPVTEEQWRANFTHDWQLHNGDYLGQLRRWLSVFPARQVYVGFYESIAGEPARLLRAIFDFLGVGRDVDLSAFPLHERILAGSGEQLAPALAHFLHRLWHDRTVELAAFLDTHFALKPPIPWQSLLAPAVEPVASDLATQADAHSSALECADSHLYSVLAEEDSFPTAYRTLLADYFGYKIFFYRGGLFALSHSCGLAVPPADPMERERLAQSADAFSAPTLVEVKDLVAQHRFAHTQGRIQSLESELGHARSQVAALEGKLDGYCAALRQVQEKAFGLASPREHALLEAVRKYGRRSLRAWRRLTTFFT
jgi:hypothetical protein